MNLISFLLRRSRSLVAMAIVAGVLGGAGSAALIALINTAVSSENDPPHWGWLFAGLCVVVPITRFFSAYLLTSLSQKAVFDLRMELSRRVLAARLRRIEEVGPGGIFAALTDDIVAISDLFINLPFSAMQFAILAGYMVFLASLSPLVFVGVFLYLLLAIVLLKLAESRASHFFRVSRDSQDALFRHYRSITDGNKELKLHTRRRLAFLDRVLEPTAETFRKSQVSGRTVYALIGGCANALFFGLLGPIIFVLPHYYPVDMRIQVSYVVTILYILAPLESIVNNFFPAMTRAAISFRKVEALGLSLESTATEKNAPLLGAGVDWRRLELAGVTHSYQREGEAGTFTVGPLDIVLEPGELVFLIGGNGSGKTTFAKILTGLYTPEAGEIRLDGEVVDDQNRDRYRQLFSAVFSDFHLFESLLGLEAPELDAKAETYVQRLQLQEKVQVKDGVLSTLNLSQGQRKRLALLTAYLEDRPIYLFDEWAADQDPQFKKVFYLELLPELKARGKTCLVISHDDHFYNLADRLIKLDAGMIEYDQRPEDAQPVDLFHRQKTAG